MEMYAGMCTREIRRLAHHSDDQLIVPGCGAFTDLLRKRPELATKDFEEYIVVNNRADRDGGELADISGDEIERLVYRWDVATGKEE